MTEAWGDTARQVRATARARLDASEAAGAPRPWTLRRIEAVMDCGRYRAEAYALVDADGAPLLRFARRLPGDGRTTRLHGWRRVVCEEMRKRADLVSDETA